MRLDLMILKKAIRTKNPVTWKKKKTGHRSSVLITNYIVVYVCVVERKWLQRKE
jgi:hypothetical protein